VLPISNDCALRERLRSCDVGSLPFTGDFEKFLRGASLYNSLLPLLTPNDPSISEPCEQFEKSVVKGLLGKLKAGIDVPNFPQFRDMNEMFLQLIEGVTKTKSGYELSGRLTVPSGKRVLPELEVVRQNASQIRDAAGRRVELKICVTGPYTLSSLLANKTSEAFRQFGEALREIVGASVVTHKNMEVTLVSVDEPVFGLASDTLLDRGSSGREMLLKAWEEVCHEAKTKGAKTLIHLHDTADELFWGVRDLDLVQSHVGDPMYESRGAKQICERSDKFIEASVAITDFDCLIRQRIVASKKRVSEASMGQLVADAWGAIKAGKVDPATYLEDSRTMRSRLARILKLFGKQRVLFAGPECGMRSFPNLECALECLRRVSKVTKGRG